MWTSIAVESLHKDIHYTNWYCAPSRHEKPIHVQETFMLINWWYFKVYFPYITKRDEANSYKWNENRLMLHYHSTKCPQKTDTETSTRRHNNVANKHGRKRIPEITISRWLKNRHSSSVATCIITQKCRRASFHVLNLFTVATKTIKFKLITVATKALKFDLKFKAWSNIHTTEHMKVIYMSTVTQIHAFWYKLIQINKHQSTASHNKMSNRKLGQS